MSVHKGNSGVIKAVTSTGTPAAVGEVKSFNVQTTGDTIDSTAMGDTARSFLGGMTSWQVALEAHYDPADNAQADLIEGASVDVELLPESGNKLTGTAIVTSVQISNEMDGIVSLSVTAQGTGALTRAAVGS